MARHTRRRHSTLAGNSPAEVRRELDEVFTVLADLEQKALDLREFLEAPLARVERETDQTIAHNTHTAIEFETMIFGHSEGMWSADDPSQLIVSKPGRYILGANVQWSGLGAGDDTLRVIFIRVNGTTIAVTHNYSHEGSSRQALTTAWELVPGDVIELVVLQSSGGDLDVQGSVPHVTSLWYQYVGESAKTSISGLRGR